jgi:flagellar hook-associated protein 1
MSLSTALNIAQNALTASSRQTAVVSRNVQNASNPDYNQRTAVLVSEAPGARALVIKRAADEMLFRQNLGASASSGGQEAIREGLERLGISVNGVDGASSASAMLGRFSEALQTFASSPSNRTLGETAVAAGADLARNLNAASAAVSSFRTETDGAVAIAVSEVNDLLQKFGDANAAVVAATRGGRDASDALDARDAALKKIAQYMPVSSVLRGDGDMVLTAASGATLFETQPRLVTFTPTASLDTAMPGKAVYVDGVPVGGADANASGKIAGLLYLRDSVSVTVGSQLDEVARGLVTAFAETDQTGGTAPARTGLFTYSGGPALPAAGALAPGLAGRVTVNALYDASKGGNPFLLRDGGANGAAYKANTAGDASFSRLLIGLGDRLEAPLALDPAAGLGAQGSVMDYASGSVGWLDAVRKGATERAETADALATRTAEALSNSTGVNVDSEMALLLDLEHAYQASARLIKTVDEMLSALMNAVG